MIEIPILVERNEANPTIGGPASLPDRVSERIRDAVRNLRIDEDTLNTCLVAIDRLGGHAAKVCANLPSVKIGEIKMELGVSAEGKVGFLGTSFGGEVKAVLQLTFKIS